jgi:hypothetical protein
MSPTPKTSPRCAGATSRTHHCDDGAPQLHAAFAPVYVRLRQDTASARHLDEIAAVRAGGATLYPQETLSCAGTAAAPRPPVSTATSRAAAVLDGGIRQLTELMTTSGFVSSTAAASRPTA